VSKHVERRQYAATADLITKMCHAAAQELGWHADGNKMLRWKEAVAGKRLLSLQGAFANRATLDITIAAAHQDSDVVYSCSNFGMGPIQTAYVRNRAEAFAAAVERGLGN
jgi:hypothetical protein